MTSRSRSLKQRLIWRLIVLQTAVLLVIVAALFASGLLFDFRSAEATIETLREAVGRNTTGALVLRPTPGMTTLQAAVPDLWFVIRDRQGQQLSEGPIPPEYARIGDALDLVGQARLGWNIGDPARPTARVRWTDSAAGQVQILTGPAGPASLYLVGLGVSLILLKDVLPIVAVMVLATIVATPSVVRGAMRGLGEAAARAERIDIDRRGMRLPADDVPIEVGSLVKAVNDALGRLDEGYERHRRFLADAAHELRTPITIITTRVAALPSGPEKTRLQEDTARLAMLTEQLLDLQRLDRRSALVPVDLIVIARRVVSDLAPLAFAAGYEVMFEPDGDRDTQPVTVLGDQMSLERALTNLVQNAIDHGGRRGTITVRVAAPGLIEVLDEGNGIPSDQQQRIFEPFYRIHPRRQGAGLGLNLVQEIMHLHGGQVAAADARSGGACMQLIFPAA